MPHKLILLAQLATLGGFSIWAHFLLSLIARSAVRTDSLALAELFAIGPAGSVLSRKPYLMRVKLFFPWIKVSSLVGYSGKTRSIVWAARLSGSLLLVCVLALLSYVAWLALSGA